MTKQPQERRITKDRRSGVDRRRINPKVYTGIEKRIDTDCRCGEDRREEKPSWSELQFRRIH